MQVRCVRQQPRDRGLAGPRRAPEDQGAKAARIQETREGAIAPQQVLLANHLRKGARPQLVGQGTRRILRKPCRCEEVGPPTSGRRFHPHNSIVVSVRHA